MEKVRIVNINLVIVLKYFRISVLCFCLPAVNWQTAKANTKMVYFIVVSFLRFASYFLIFEMVLAVDFVALSMSLMAKSMAASIKASTFGFL